VLLLGGIYSLACDRTDEPTGSAAQALQRPKSVSGSVSNDPQFDAPAAQEILRLVNQSRAQASEPPLVLDEALSLAAQVHGREMLQHGELSHQFPGEPGLRLRLGQSGLHFNQAGENVALDFSAQHAHQSLMASDEHRRNLLNPSFNAVGIAVVWDRCQMYVVQDFAQRLPTYAAGQAEDLIAAKVATLRNQTQLPRLNRLQSRGLAEASCSMEKTGPVHPAASPYANVRYVLSYSNAEPGALPPSAGNVIGNGQMRDFSVGACYARTEKHPSGAYFVTMMFY
jgi:uncharacterized protein YkwD